MRLLFCALCTTATFGLDIFIEILFTVVVEELFTKHNIALRLYPYMTLNHVALGVGATGVVDIARGIPARGTVNIRALVDANM